MNMQEMVGCAEKSEEYSAEEERVLNVQPVKVMDGTTEVSSLSCVTGESRVMSGVLSVIDSIVLTMNDADVTELKREIGEFDPKEREETIRRSAYNTPFSILTR